MVGLHHVTCLELIPWYASQVSIAACEEQALVKQHLKGMHIPESSARTQRNLMHRPSTQRLQALSHGSIQR